MPPRPNEGKKNRVFRTIGVRQLSASVSLGQQSKTLREEEISARGRALRFKVGGGEAVSFEGQWVKVTVIQIDVSRVQWPIPHWSSRLIHLVTSLPGVETSRNRETLRRRMQRLTGKFCRDHRDVIFAPAGSPAPSGCDTVGSNRPSVERDSLYLPL